MKKRNRKKGGKKKGFGSYLSAFDLALIVGVLALAATLYLHETLPPLEPQPAPPPAAAPDPGLSPAPVEPPVPEVSAPIPPRLAIVIDDVGINMAPIKKLIKLGVPLTFAILPRQKHSVELANLIYEAGYEVIAHLPMEPENRQGNNPGKGALLVSASDDEIRREVTRMISEMPHAVGASNHMGSRFTMSYSRMRIVLDVVKSSGLYFLDSRTTAESIAYKVAREMGVRSASRKVFIDNERDTEAIKSELRRAIRVTLKKGEAVAIGHPHRETIEALAQMREAIKNAGVQLVFVSTLVR